jgi:hypothetical protein
MTHDDDSLLRRLRNNRLAIGKLPERGITAPPPKDESVRESVRLLARSRVSQILRQLRATRGYSYEQVREKTGLSQQLLFDVEYKDRRLSLDELRLLARLYDLSVNDILGIDLDL